MILTLNRYASRNGFMPDLYEHAGLTKGLINRSGKPWIGVETEPKRTLISYSSTSDLDRLALTIGNYHVNQIIKSMEAQS